MQIKIEDARDLVQRAMERSGYSSADAETITGQIIGCELRGVAFAGLSRALSLIERTVGGPPQLPMRILRESPVSALIDGGNTCGYIVAPHAVALGIEKARANGIGAVGANNTWYSGMYVHYLEQATDAGLVAMAVGSSAPRVAPHGATEGRFGTNPIAFAFPSNGDPIIFDAATSAIAIAEAVLAQRTGRRLSEGVAYGPDGVETTDPFAAVAGAIKAWGGHRGSGLGIVVQLLGILAGGGLMPADYMDCGFFFLAIRPDLFMDEAEYRGRVSEYAALVRAARPVEGGGPVRMPFDRSAENRRRILAAGAFETPDEVVAALRRVAGA